MLKVSVVSKSPAPSVDQITVFLDMGSRALAARSTLRAHPAWSDVERRLERGPITSPYLTSSEIPLVVMPAAVAKRYSVEDQIRTLAADALALARDRRAKSVVYVLDGARGADAAVLSAEALALSSYRFDRYKKSPENGSEPEISLLVNGKQAVRVRSQVEKTLSLCGSVNKARDLINEPGSVATPAEIEARARAVARRGKLGVTVLDHKQLAKEGYEGLLAVGRGGEVPPRMIVLSYKPKGAPAGKHLGLLGKGVSFDTGGVSIKSAPNMWQMKGDMSGAAAVIYAMDAIAQLKPKVRVTAIIVTAQNYVDSKAIVPGDIMRGRNGKTVQIDNTDAEGRLILTDGLWRAGEEKVTHLVDIATLTGAIMRALGNSVSGAFGNDNFVDRVVKVADRAGEPTWKMPLVEEYLDLLKCDVADLNNIGSNPNGGAITAALFLREFVPEGVSWCHLDIAGTFLADRKTRYFGPGATGVMVRTLTGLAHDLAGR